MVPRRSWLFAVTVPFWEGGFPRALRLILSPCSSVAGECDQPLPCCSSLYPASAPFAHSRIFPPLLALPLTNLRSDRLSNDRGERSGKPSPGAVSSSQPVSHLQVATDEVGRGTERAAPRATRTKSREFSHPDYPLSTSHPLTHFCGNERTFLKRKN